MYSSTLSGFHETKSTLIKVTSLVSSALWRLSRFPLVNQPDSNRLPERRPGKCPRPQCKRLLACNVIARRQVGREVAWRIHGRRSTWPTHSAMLRKMSLTLLASSLGGCVCLQFAALATSKFVAVSDAAAASAALVVAISAAINRQQQTQRQHKQPEVRPFWLQAGINASASAAASASTSDVGHHPKCF